MHRLCLVPILFWVIYDTCQKSLTCTEFEPIQPTLPVTGWVTTEPIGPIVQGHGFETWLKDIQYIACSNETAQIRMILGIRSIHRHSYDDVKLSSLHINGDTECNGFPHRVTIHQPKVDSHRVYEVLQISMDSKCMNITTACHSPWSCERQHLQVVTQFGKTPLGINIHRYQQCPKAIKASAISSGPI